MGMNSTEKTNQKVVSINSQLKEMGNMNKNTYKTLKVFVHLCTFCIFVHRNELYSKNYSKMLSINSQFKEVGNMNKNAHKCLKACTSCFWLFFWPWECKPSKHYSKITPINIWEFLLQERGQINPITIVVLLGLHDRFKEKGQGRSQRARGSTSRRRLGFLETHSRNTLEYRWELVSKHQYFWEKKC